MSQAMFRKTAADIPDDLWKAPSPVARHIAAGEFWQKLTEVASDPWPYSSWKTPSLVFTDVVVSGA